MLPEMPIRMKGIASIRPPQRCSVCSRRRNAGQLTEERISAIALAGQWLNADVTLTLEWLLAWAHDLARWRVGASSAVMDTLPEGIQERLRHISLSVLHRYLEKLLSIKKQLLSGANPNKQLLLEEVLLDWGLVLRRRAGAVAS